MKWSPESMTLPNWKLGRTGAARGEEKRWFEMESDQHTPGTGKQAVSRMRGYSLHPQRSVGEDWRSRVAEQSRISVYRVGSRAGWQAGTSKDRCAVGSGGDLDTDSSSQRLERRSALSKSMPFNWLNEAHPLTAGNNLYYIFWFKY